MTRQVVIAKGALRLNKADVALLSYLYLKTPGAGEFVSVSTREMAGVTAVLKNTGTLRRCISRLEAAGLLEVEAVFAADGGQRANRYRLTSTGLLAAAAIAAGEGRSVDGEIMHLEITTDTAEQVSPDEVRTSALRMDVLLDKPDYVLGEGESDFIGSSEQDSDEKIA